MKKNILTIMASALLVAGLMSCGSSGGSSTIGDYCDDLEELRKLDRNKSRDKIEMIERNTIAKEVTMEVNESAPFKVAKDFVVTRVAPIYCGMDLEGQIETSDPDMDMGEFCLVACDGSKPLKILPYKSYPYGDVIILELHLNVGNLVNGGEKAKDEIRNIDRIVITNKDSDLMRELEDAKK